MRFIFCGDKSAPEWFLAESQVIAKLVTSLITECPQTQNHRPQPNKPAQTRKLPNPIRAQAARAARPHSQRN